MGCRRGFSRAFKVVLGSLDADFPEPSASVGQGVHGP